MLRRSSFAVVLLLLATLSACGGDDLPPPPLEVYENGRAEVISRADSGRALLIEHEPFDSTMTQPMVMELRLANPREAQDIQKGDKIRFDLALDGDYRLRNVEKLPASTRLQLTPDSTATGAADSSATDTSAVDTSAAGS